MKKILLFSMFLSYAGIVNAQYGIEGSHQFSIGATVGIPMGQVSDIYDLAYGIDAKYVSWSGAGHGGFGIASGYLNYSGTEADGINVENASFIPAALVLVFDSWNGKFEFEADLGYAFALSPDDLEGGIYYRPTLSFNVDKRFAVNLSYSAVHADGLTFSNLGIGLRYNITENDR
jgi:hypothetical protein